jgi:hypothetical protein
VDNDEALTMENHENSRELKGLEIARGKEN